MIRNYSGEIKDAIQSFLTQYRLQALFDEQEGVFRFDLAMEGRIREVRYIIAVREDEYMVYVICPLAANNGKNITAEMAEFICRANYGLKNGNFELGMDDGVIRYKAYVDCTDTVPDREVVKNSIFCPAAMFDRYSEGIVEIIFGNMSAKEAVEKCEKPKEEEYPGSPV